MWVLAQVAGTVFKLSCEFPGILPRLIPGIPQVIITSLDDNRRASGTKQIKLPP